MTVRVFEDGHCPFDGIPCGEPGTDGWNSLHEHIALLGSASSNVNWAG